MGKPVIIQSGNQIHAQHKTPAPIAITLRQNAKDFQFSNYVFNHDSLSCQCAVGSFLLFAQFRSLRLFHRRSCPLMQLKNALVARICQTFSFLQPADFTVFVQRKVMSCAFAKTSVENLPRMAANANLRFYCMSLFLARIIAALFFFGRSISLSAASTTTISISSGKSRNLLPGNSNSLAEFKMFSTRVIMREIVDSDKPQLLAMWNCVRYSRQYSSVKRTWSSTTSLLGLPATNRCLADLSLTISHILSKVCLFTPQYRLKSAFDSIFSFS